LKAQWEQEKAIIKRIRDIKEEIEKLRLKEESAERQANYELVAKLRYGEKPQLEKELKELTQKLENFKNRLLKEEVDAEDIAEVVSRWTHIPLTKLLETEKDKLLKIETRLKTRLVGQDEAISVVADAIRRSRAGLADPNRPYASFLFLGATGVGKTELARSLAWFLFDDEKAMVRLDMSEFMERHSVAKLIGAPPGYVGYEEGGQLTEIIRRRPYSVILLDEIEKAHPEVFNILLQILDDGRLTDSRGKTVNFKNTIVIMTSNIGSELIYQIKDRKVLTQRLQESLRQHFRPEFLNRIDEIVIFNLLDLEDIKKIVDIQINYLNQRLKEKGLELILTEKARDYLANQGFDATFGARPLKRCIQKLIQDKLAKDILENKFKEGDKIIVDISDDKLTFRKPC
jgi:ATP-dependent Clp protease ATP-binding subunit ClpB